MEYLSPVLRFCLYGATVLIAGSIALRLTLSVPAESAFSRRLTGQVSLGLALMFVAAVGSVALFLLMISGGDVAMAFSAEFMGIAAQTPVGQVAAMRVLAGVALLILLALGWHRLALVPALLMLLSFGMEGHSLSFGPRLLSSSLVVVHVAIAAWWLSVIFPLLTVSATERDRFGEVFGRQAILAVPLLIVAGGALFGVFTGWQLDLSQDYQRRMAFKLVAVAGILSIAAANKLYFTGRPGFVWSLRVEALVAVALLMLTAFLTATGPKM
ncbi:MAG: hypothetical protein ACPG42_09725 [Alphaproteobacteria bacterium]